MFWVSNIRNHLRVKFNFSIISSYSQNERFCLVTALNFILCLSTSGYTWWVSCCDSSWWPGSCPKCPLLPGGFSACWSRPWLCTSRVFKSVWSWTITAVYGVNATTRRATARNWITGRRADKSGNRSEILGELSILGVNIKHLNL